MNWVEIDIETRWLVSCICWWNIVGDLYRVINQRFKKTASICCHRSFGNLYVEIRDLCSEFATVPKFTTSASRMLKYYHVYSKTCILDNVLTDCIHCWWSLLRPWCVHRLCRVECARAVVWLRCCYESQTRLDMTVLVAVHEIEWTYSHVMCWVCWREYSIYRDLNEVKIGEMINWFERLQYQVFECEYQTR